MLILPRNICIILNRLPVKSMKVKIVNVKRNDTIRCFVIYLSIIFIKNFPKSSLLKLDKTDILTQLKK